MFLQAQTRQRKRRLGESGGWARYSEQVVKRHGNGGYTIMLRPLSGLGAAPLGPTLVAAGGNIGVVASTPSLIALLGPIGGPIGAGIGVLVGVIAAAWAAHDARAAGAKTENAAVNSAVIAFDASLKATFAAANAGQVTGSQAAQVCSQIMSSYWQGMAPYQVGPGRADASKGGTNCGTGLNPGGPCIGMPYGPPCNASCTAGCCVGCQDLYPTILQAIAVFSSTTGGTITACNVSGSSYGATARGSYSLTYTPPAASSIGGVANSVTSAATDVSTALSTGSLSSLETSTIGGIPLWLLLAGGGLAAYLVATR